MEEQNNFGSKENSIENITYPIIIYVSTLYVHIKQSLEIYTSKFVLTVEITFANMSFQGSIFRICT
jgi:hypothetical protein